MKRAIVLALSVILALVMAAPMATALQAPKGQDLPDNWWNWAFQSPTETSPLVGDYSEGPQCDGSDEETGVWFLAGEFALEGDIDTGFVGEATRDCTIPANTPIFFPVVNSLCGEAPTAPTPDPTPYTECAKEFLDESLENEGDEMFATLNGRNLNIKRIASGPFTWTIPEFGEPPQSDNPWDLPAGKYDSATEGYWVYLQQGLKPGTYTLKYGGSFYEGFFVLDITYNLTVV